MASRQTKPELRIVLIGKTGGGKTSAMNTLLGSPSLTPLSASSGTTECQMKRGACGDQPLMVIDTPGLVHTKLAPDAQVEKMLKFLVHAAPGPHVFLYVQTAGALTQEDDTAVKVFHEVFGRESKSHTLVLFTGGGAEELSEEHRSFVDDVSYGNKSENYHFFDNTGGGGEPSDQVPELLEKIYRMVRKNKEKPYTNDKLKDVEKVKQEIKKKKGVASGDATLADQVVKAILEQVIGQPLASRVLTMIQNLVKKMNELVSKHTSG